MASASSPVVKRSMTMQKDGRRHSKSFVSQTPFGDDQPRTLGKSQSMKKVKTYNAKSKNLP